MRRGIQLFSVVQALPRKAWYATGNDFQTTYGGLCEPGDAVVAHCVPYAVQFGAERIVSVAYDSRDPLLDATFLHAHLREAARSLVSIPFERLDDVAGRAWRTRPGEARPIFIFSPGRAGSTLLCKLLATFGIPGLSEPDIFTHYAVTKIRSLEVPGAELVPAVLGGMTAGLLHAAGSARAAVKFRSHVNAIAAELMSAVPGASGFMLLRDPAPWAASVHRAFGWQTSDIAASLALAFRGVNACRVAGRPLTLLHYEDLVERPDEFLAGLADAGGLASSDLDRAQLARVLEADAQAGTYLSRQNLSAANVPENFPDEFVACWGRERELLRADGIEVPENFR